MAWTPGPFFLLCAPDPWPLTPDPWPLTPDPWPLTPDPWPLTPELWWLAIHQNVYHGRHFPWSVVCGMDSRSVHFQTTDRRHHLPWSLNPESARLSMSKPDLWNQKWEPWFPAVRLSSPLISESWLLVPEVGTMVPCRAAFVVLQFPDCFPDTKSGNHCSLQAWAQLMTLQPLLNCTPINH